MADKMAMQVADNVAAHITADITASVLTAADEYQQTAGKIINMKIGSIGVVVGVLLGILITIGLKNWFAWRRKNVLTNCCTKTR